MKTLTTYVKRADPRNAQVYWDAGSQKGILEFESPIDYGKDMAAVAELVAIKHLLYTRFIFGNIANDARKLQLRVTSGAVKKLARATSDKDHLVMYGGFLRCRLAGVDIKCVSKFPTFGVEWCESFEAITIEPEMYGRKDVLMTPSLGRLEVSLHAVDRYEQRFCTVDGLGWANLGKKLMDSRLQQIEMPESVISHKTVKYGTADNVELWTRDYLDAVFLVVVGSRGERVLVTVFDKNKMTR